MNVIGLTADEQNSIFKILAAILWLGNVDFVEGDDGNATISDAGVIDFAAYLLDVQPAHLQKALLTRIMETTRGGRRGLSSRSNDSQADPRLGLRSPSECCTSFVRSRCPLKGPVSLFYTNNAYDSYNNLFEWIVSRVNVSMKPQSASEYVIGVLDI